MTSRPRVTARSEIESLAEHDLCGRYAHATPSVVIEVSFDLHDHAAALSLLDATVNDVRRQIEEARPTRETEPPAGSEQPLDAMTERAHPDDVSYRAELDSRVRPRIGFWGGPVTFGRGPVAGGDM